MRKVNASGTEEGTRLPQAGARLRAAMHTAMERTPDVRSVIGLAEKAGVQRGTIYETWSGRLPKPGTMDAYAQALNVPVGDLWAAWDGRTAAEADELAALVRALKGQTEAINELLSRLDSLATSAVREGVAEALREVAERPADGASQSAPPRARRP